MTRLTKNVRRETTRIREKGRPIIVILEPGDTIAFREKGRRQVFRTTLAACFWMAVKAEARAEKLARAAARRSGRSKTRRTA